MALHELGHVAGAMLTGGSIERVVLHPLTISRTDVLPNPNPGVVAWLGPIAGCVLPIAAALVLPTRGEATRTIALFFGGFCLVANGVYIAAGSFGGVGDAGVMLRSGSPQRLWLLFGFTATGLGMFTWHCLGAPANFLRDPSVVPRGSGYALLVALLVVVSAMALLSPR